MVMKKYLIHAGTLIINILSILLLFGFIIFIFTSIDMKDDISVIISVIPGILLIFILLNFSKILINKTNATIKDYIIALVLFLFSICWFIF